MRICNIKVQLFALIGGRVDGSIVFGRNDKKVKKRKWIYDRTIYGIKLSKSVNSFTYLGNFYDQKADCICNY